MSDRFEKIKEIIVNQLNIDEKVVTREADFVDDLGADSIDTVELVMAIENEFGIDIPEAEAARMKKVNDLLTYIESKA